MSLYKAKTLSGAQARVRQLEKQRDDITKLLTTYDYERKVLARLAAKTPEFYNPFRFMEAQDICDRILREIRAKS